MNHQVIIGDCLTSLRSMASESVNTCVTSPPYFGLRDYGHDGQMGLESTPEEYVAKMVEVFREVRREVRRVLRDDGTMWLNIGDSYNGYMANQRGTGLEANRQQSRKYIEPGAGLRTSTLKNKDLIGIPWMLAKALRDPYYTGPVKDICDQVWLAAMLDAEGSICGTEYQSGDRIKTNIYISITNTSVPVIEKCDRVFPQELKHIYEKANGTSNRKCFRWDVERMDQKALFLRTIYPHLVAKRKQAIIGYTFIEMQRGLMSKKKGYLSEQHEQRSWLMMALSLLNSGQDVDIPGWCIEPPNLFEPGYYLRQDLIWAKPNPMPESVTDRCTKAHEYIFLLSKSPRYYFDQEAMKEPAVTGWNGSEFHEGKTADHQLGRSSKNRKPRPAGNKTHKYVTEYEQSDSEQHRTAAGLLAQAGVVYETRNRRSVWTVTTKPYKGAHFAVFPPDLIRPCVEAGCPKDGTVLDPFGGSGTTGQVAIEEGRNVILLEINPDYEPLITSRLRNAAHQVKMLFPA